MSISNELINRYPWLPSLKEYYFNIGSEEPTKFINDIFSKEIGGDIKERLLKIFEAAFENLEEIPDYNDDNLNVYVYVLLKILLYTLDNKMITNRIANLYSKNTYKEMEREHNDSNLYNICKDLGLRIRYYDPPVQYGIFTVKDQHQKLKTNFTIFYVDYLNLASKLRDEYRKLTHVALTNGYIFIQNRGLIRLIQEYVREKLLIEETGDKSALKIFLKAVLAIKEFKDLYDKIVSAWALRKDDFDFTFKIDFKSKEDITILYPPCVKEILKKAKSGQNLVHYERLYIVWFLLALDYPVEKVVNMFSTLPDFDRGRTTYQVEFAKRKKYIPYQCSTLQSFNLCMAVTYKDELCLKGYGSKDPLERKKLKHPLGYVRIKQYRAIKEKEYLKNRKKLESEQ